MKEVKNSIEELKSNLKSIKENKKRVSSVLEKYREEYDALREEQKQIESKIEFINLKNSPEYAKLLDGYIVYIDEDKDETYICIKKVISIKLRCVEYHERTYNINGKYSSHDDNLSIMSIYSDTYKADRERFISEELKYCITKEEYAKHAEKLSSLISKFKTIL